MIHSPDYQNMQPQEIDPRFLSEKKIGKKGLLISILFTVLFVAILGMIAALLSVY